MENNVNELKTCIGNEEAARLQPAKVEIISAKIEEVGQKKAKKVVCECKHPQAPETIKISAMKYENKGKLEVSGIWFNTDKANLIRKGSALAILLQSHGCNMIEDLIHKQLDTVLDDKGYLVFKGY